MNNLTPGLIWLAGVILINMVASIGYIVSDEVDSDTVFGVSLASLIWPIGVLAFLLFLPVVLGLILGAVVLAMWESFWKGFNRRYESDT